MPGIGGNWKSKSEKRATKKALQDFSRSAKRVLDYETRRKTDDPLSIPKKGYPLEKSFYNSHWINKKNINRQNRDDERAGWWTRRPKEKYSKAWLRDSSIVDPIPEEEVYDTEETGPLKKPLPRTLESLIPEGQHEKLGTNEDDAVLQLAIAMSLHETQENQENRSRIEEEKLQEALLLSIRDSTPASSWQDIGASEHSVSTAAWQEIGGSELSVPVSINRWVHVAPEVSPDEIKNEDGPRSASPGTEQSWSLI